MRTEATAEAALPLVLWAPASVPSDIVTVLVLVVAGHGGVGHVVAGLRAQATRLQQDDDEVPIHFDEQEPSSQE